MRKLSVNPDEPLNFEMKASEELDLLCSGCQRVFKGKTFYFIVKELGGNIVLAYVAAPTVQKPALCPECLSKKMGD